jgi:hypothetical protein
MFFSAFYHACDKFGYFCLIELDSLQLGDFIAAYTSIVVTVLSVSALDRQFKVLTYFFGVFLALTFNLYDRFNKTLLIILLVFASFVTIASWV